VSGEPGLEFGDDDWWQEAERRAVRDVRRSRRRASLRRAARWLPLGLVVAVVIGAGGWYARGGPADGAPSAPPKSRPAVALEPSRRALSATDLGDPYLGTPAARFAVGAAGLVPPAATPVGGHSAAEVATHLASAKRLLILSRLDPRMLERRDPAAFLAALSPTMRGLAAPTFAGSGAGSTSYASRLAPGRRLLAPPRVDGSMTVRTGKHGEVVVATDYVFVYPVAGDLPVYDRAATHVIVRAKVDFSFIADQRFIAANQGVMVSVPGAFSFNIDCALIARGLLAPSSKLAAPGATPDRERSEYYRAGTPIPAEQGCPGP
jgi:hypothetical protein